ncbi:MAG: calcium/sodium antiporter [Clostridia bacterium]|nr:calcium/sodium antiporter [Clostridia bacterium]
MEYFICIICLIIGIILVVKGGDWFVDAASWMAEVSGIPTFIIGATIVSLATTLPEILVSSISAAKGSAGLAIGNAVGSVNCNIALIMAVSLIFMPAAFKRKNYAAKMIILIVSIVLLYVLSATGDGLTWWQGLIVLIPFIAFMTENIISAKKNADLKELIDEDEKIKKENLERGTSLVLLKDFVSSSKPVISGKGTVTLKRTGITLEKSEIVKKILLFIIGAAAIVGGAELMCIYGERFAQLLGVPDEIIGVTILAVGTSLPELVTTLTAISKKKSELSVGNVIGANIIDITLILSLCSFISAGKTGMSLPINAQCIALDFPFCIAAAAIACIPALIAGKFRRWQGIVMLLGYVAYIVILVLSTPQIALINF